MISVTGLSNIDMLNTEFVKKIDFSLNIDLKTTGHLISKINSIMCIPSNVELKKSPTGILVIVTYNLKIIYISENSESLYVWKSSYTKITNLKTPFKIGWDSIDVLIKRNKLFPKIEIYEIFCDKVDSEKLFIKVYCHLKIDYLKPLNICLNIQTDSATSNLFLSNDNLNSLEQITFNTMETIEQATFDKNLSQLYFIKKSNHCNFLQCYNLKTKSFKTILDEFTSIFNFKVFSTFLLVYGETAFTKGIFKIDTLSLAIDILYQSETIYEYTYNLDTVYILDKTNPNMLLYSIPTDLLLEMPPIRIDILDGIFIDNFLLYLDSSKNLKLMDLKKNIIFELINNSNIIKLNTGILCKEEIFILFSNSSTESGIISYNFLTKKIKYLINKKVNITSLIIVNEMNTLYFSFKSRDFIEIYSLKARKITRLLKISALDILLSNHI